MVSDSEALLQTIETDIVRADAVQRGEMPHQHEIAAGKLPGLFDGVDVRRTLHHANLTVFLTTRVRADVAYVLLGKGTAIRTVTNF